MEKSDRKEKIEKNRNPKEENILRRKVDIKRFSFNEPSPGL